MRELFMDMYGVRHRQVEVGAAGIWEDDYLRISREYG